ncbi:DUF4276 family protein [Spirosoma fluviale]|uniref:DUF4276 family protein n=1 Tax=Spirosoma fluviale TaxID=1597977 RepID=A0A286F7A8_9BACT|nr:DUF4276 family protein [Spirosoma fluviale]SOD79105.1 protein of unknown function [Spirosoma fluviale]
MVKVGFIVEGACEKIILKATEFKAYLQSKGIEQVGDVIDMDGKGNLKSSSQRMITQVQLLRDSGAVYVVILRDMDNAKSFSAVKNEVYQAEDTEVCIAVQELEAWFLADSNTLSTLFQTSFTCDLPETIINPFELLVALRKQYTGRGIGDKKVFARTMLVNGFTIENAAKHPNCPSASYFLTKLQTLASAN